MVKVAVVGSSGHARVVTDILERLGRYQVVGLIDSFRAPGPRVDGYEILGTEDSLPRLTRALGIEGLVLAIGDNYGRMRMAEKIRHVAPDLPFVTAVHPSCHIGRDVVIGDGTVIMPGVVLNCGCRIGKLCILNTNSSLDHDGLMEDCSSLGPNVATGGGVRIGRCTAVCIGTTIVEKVSIGDNAVVGAGATVLSDLPNLVLAYGTPAKIIRTRDASERYLV